MQAAIAFVLFFAIMLCGGPLKYVARDTIPPSTPLADNGETLVSAGKRFELGFFNPEGSNNGDRYVGMWYYQKSGPITVVWIANRGHALQGQKFCQDVGCFFGIKDGNLKLWDKQGASYFDTRLESSSAINGTIKLLDNGNLVLNDSLSGKILWESFKNPTDTFLPGMQMDDQLNLTSWRTPADPKSGIYVFRQDQDDNKRYVITSNRPIPYWISDQSYGIIPGGSEMPRCVAALLSNFSPSVTAPRDNKSINYSAIDNPCDFSDNVRLVMDSSGKIQFYRWDGSSGWRLSWSEPHDNCPCGKFGVCSNRNGRLLTCDCLPGFVPFSPDNWNSQEYSGGCVRKLPCGKTTKQDTFLNLKSMKVGGKFLRKTANDEEECKRMCLDNCQCQGYSYVDHWRSPDSAVENDCLMWNSDIANLQKASGNLSISIRVAAASIELTSRDCESCGANVIPYPLSSGLHCGDPSYRSFSCDYSTGQLNFLTLNDSYEVMSINSSERCFVIAVNVENAGNCSSKHASGRVLPLNQSLPFNVINWCYSDPRSTRNDPLNGGQNKIEISWKPPLEPLCNSYDDCNDWPNSACNVTENGLMRCLCNPNYRWDGQTALRCSPTVGAPITQQREGSIPEMKLIAFITGIAVVLLVGIFGFIFYKRRNLAKRKV